MYIHVEKEKKGKKKDERNVRKYHFAKKAYFLREV